MGAVLTVAPTAGQITVTRSLSERNIKDQDTVRVLLSDSTTQLLKANLLQALMANSNGLQRRMVKAHILLNEVELHA
ncbi:MAG: hypothetical protein ACI92C_002880 [Neolewinella sp.]